MKTKYTNHTHAPKLITIGLALASLALGPLHASPNDLDGDGIANRFDRDVDDDGIPNGIDRNVDGGVCRKGPFKGRFVGDHLSNGSNKETDIDGDGLADDAKSEDDIDGDGRKDKVDDDIDGDGRKNGADDDCDGDGRSRRRDVDDDGDGADDSVDSDDDNDRHSDEEESEVEVNLAPTSAAPAGSRMKVETTLKPNGNIELKYDGRNLAAGAYDIVIGSQVIGQIEMIQDDDRTEGRVRFVKSPDKPGELPLPFNPVGLASRIARGDTTYFSGTVPVPSDIFIHR